MLRGENTVIDENSEVSIGMTGSLGQPSFPAVQSSWSYQEDDASALAGVGIHFVHEHGLTKVVKIVRGGAAARDGTVLKGDELITVGGRQVSGVSLADLRHLLLGVAGTFIRLGFLRGTPNGKSMFEVELQRGSPEYLARDQTETLKKKLDAAQANVSELRRVLAGKEDEQRQNLTEIDNLSNVVKQMQQEISKSRSLSAEIQRERDEIAEKCRFVEENGNREREELHALLAESVNKMKILQNDLAASKQTSEQLSESCQILREERDAVARAEEAARAQIGRLERELEEERASHRAAEEAIHNLKIRYTDLDGRLRGVEMNLDVETRAHRESEARETEALQQLAECQRRERDLSAEIRNFVVRNQVNEEQINEMRNTIDEVQRKLENESDRLGAEQRARRALMDRLHMQEERMEQSLAEERKHAQNAIAAQDQTLLEIQSQLANAKLLIDDFERKANLNEATLRGTQARLHQADEECQNLRLQIVDLNRALEDARFAAANPPPDPEEPVRVKSLLSQRDRLVSEISEIQSELNSLREELDRIRKTNGGLRAELNVLNVASETERERSKQLEADVLRLKSIIESKDSEIRNILDDVNESEKRAADLRTGLEGANRRLQSLQKLDEAVTELRGLKEAAEAEALALRRHVGALETRGRDVSVRLETAERENAGLEKARVAAEAESARIRVESLALYSSLVEIRGQIQSLQENIGNKERQITVLSQENEQLRLASEHVLVERDESRRERDRERTDKEKEKEKREDFEKRVKDLTDRVGNMRPFDEYERVCGELSVVKRALEEREGVVRRLEAEAESMKWEINSANQHREGLETALENVRVDLKATHEQLNSLKTAAATADQLGARNEVLDKEIVNLRSQIQSLKADIERLQSEISREKEKNAGLEQNLDEMREREREMKILFEEERSRTAEVSRQLQASVTQHNAATAHVDALKSQIQALKAQNASSPNAEAQLYAAKAAHEEAMDSLRRDAIKQQEGLHQEIARLRSQSAELRADVERGKVSEERERKAKLMVDQLRAQMEQVKGENESLRSNVRMLTSHRQAALMERDRALALLSSTPTQQQQQQISYNTNGYSNSNNNTPASSSTPRGRNTPLPLSSFSSNPSSSSDLCGVGMEVEGGGGGGELYVKRLVKGMAADASRSVELGDVLVAIGGRRVFGMTASDIRPLILGRAGTEVAFVFRRNGNEFNVILKRGEFKNEEDNAPSPSNTPAADPTPIQPISSEPSVEYSAALVF